MSFSSFLGKRVSAGKLEAEETCEPRDSEWTWGISDVKGEVTGPWDTVTGSMTFEGKKGGLERRGVTFKRDLGQEYGWGTLLGLALLGVSLGHSKISWAWS